MKHSQRFFPQRPLTDSEAAALAREVLEQARDAWRATHGSGFAHKRPAPLQHHAWARRLATPAMFHGFAANFEFGIIAACVLACLCGVLRHLLL